MLVRAGGSVVLGDPPWPPGLDPEEDEGLRVSSVLARRDAIAAAAPAIHALDRRRGDRATALLDWTAHALVLRHGFRQDELGGLLAPWDAATGDIAEGAAGSTAGPAVGRR